MSEVNTNTAHRTTMWNCLANPLGTIYIRTAIHNGTYFATNCFLDGGIDRLFP